MPIFLYQVVAQLRVHNSNNRRIILEKETYKFRDGLICHRCNKNSSLMHLLTECDIFKEKRLKSKLPLIDSILDLHSILEKPDLK